MVIERRVCETCDGFGDTLTRGLDGDVIVLLEVDTGLLLGGVVGHAEEVALEALQAGGIVEFGEREEGVWRVRMAVPV